MLTVGAGDDQRAHLGEVGDVTDLALAEHRRQRRDHRTEDLQRAGDDARLGAVRKLDPDHSSGRHSTLGQGPRHRDRGIPQFGVRQPRTVRIDHGVGVTTLIGVFEQ